jgi:hypothetical protein
LYLDLIPEPIILDPETKAMCSLKSGVVMSQIDPEPILLDPDTDPM